MIGEAEGIIAFADEIRRAGFKNVLVLGMGGSGLAADMLSTEFSARAGFPDVYVLDSTDSEVIATVRGNFDARTTLYIVSSKSGTTTEVRAFFAYFWDQVTKKRAEKARKSFIAITDAGSPLVELAAQHNFRRVFESLADMGGRYAALSYSGLLPAALMGVDIRRLLLSASEMQASCAPDIPAAENPGLVLGATLATHAQAGRDKVTFLISPNARTFGDWAEQLLAESTGKDGKGLIPVVGEPVGPPNVYGDDRTFIYLRVHGDDNEDNDVAADLLQAADFPLLRLDLKGKYDFGGEFFRWEVAAAVAAKVLGVNPFDEPNVAESKQNTAALLEEYATTGRLPEQQPLAEEDVIELYAASGVAPESADLAGYVRALLHSIAPGDYFSILAYLDPSEENEDFLQTIRVAVRDSYRVATTIGYGPRYLHTTGQLHKGGPASGVHLIITADEVQDIKIPEQSHTFGTLLRAQAAGDVKALTEHNRRLLWLHLANPEDGLTQLRMLVIAAIMGKHE